MKLIQLPKTGIIWLMADVVRSVRESDTRIGRVICDKDKIEEQEPENYPELKATTHYALVSLRFLLHYQMP